MQPIQLPNAAASILTISTTAVTLQDAIGAAGSDTGFKIPSDADGIDLICETNSVRFMTDGLVPTASLGTLLDSSGDIVGVNLRGTPARKVQLIRAGGSDASVSVRLGRTNNN